MNDATEVISHILSNDLIVGILLRLPAKSIARFRCVSKLWFSITTSPSFLHDHTSDSPIFILIQTAQLKSNGCDLCDIDLQLLPPTADAVLPERRCSTTDVIVASCDGLLCLFKECQEQLDNYKYDIPSYYVLNPLTGAQIDVPKPTNPHGRLLGFYFHPSTCEYRLIRRKYSDFDFEVELISLGGEAWRTIDCTSCGDSGCGGHPIDINGILYWIAYNPKLCKASGILGFDVIEEEFKMMPLPSKYMIILANGNLFDIEKRLGLSIINKELSSINGPMIDIWVMNDFDGVEWEKIYSLSCFGGLGIDMHINSLVCIWRKEFVFLFYGPDLYLVRFDLKAMKCDTVQVDAPRNFIWDCSILYKESLISYDSFLIK